jgi:uncharacterized membrane protein YsdA (DUF1294 family)/cold shock CspA family protein
MRTQGKITHWNDDKGYGFITPASGAKQVFFQINAFNARGVRPQLDQHVTFALSMDRQGRPCAARVALAGEEISGEIKRNDRVLMIGASVFFLLFVGLAAWSGSLPGALFGFYLGICALTFLVYAMDKSAAQSGARRIREAHLHGLALIGGWPGAMLAQQLLRHKSVKQEFRAVFWATVVMNLAAFAWLFTDSGSEFLRHLLASI